MIRSRRSSGSASVKVLALLLLALIGAGAWNYQRNLRIEEQSRAARPLASYSTADLEALAAAYRGEVSTRAARYEKARSQRSNARERQYFDEQVREFESVQRQSTRSREAGAELSEHETALQQVEQELALRGPAESEWQQHWRRVISF